MRLGVRKRARAYHALYLRPKACRMSVEARLGCVCSLVLVSSLLDCCTRYPADAMTDRARREKQERLAKLAELKRAREGGGRSYKVLSRVARPAG